MSELARLFSDLANYTHLYVLSYMNKLDTTHYFYERLLENQKEIANFVGKKYGEAQSKNIDDVLTDQIEYGNDFLLLFDKTEPNIYEIESKEGAYLQNAALVGRSFYDLDPSIFEKSLIIFEFNIHAKLFIELVNVYVKEKNNEIVLKYDAYYKQTLKIAKLVSDYF